MCIRDSYGDRKQQSNPDAHYPGGKADNDRFGVEHAGNVFFPGADAAQDADLLGPLQDGYIRYNADHDRRDEKRYRRESDEDVTNNVNNRANRANHNLNQVGINNFIGFLGLGCVISCLLYTSRCV